jgi:hypothetical protein
MDYILASVASCRTYERPVWGCSSPLQPLAEAHSMALGKHHEEILMRRRENVSWMSFSTRKKG